MRHVIAHRGVTDFRNLPLRSDWRIHALVLGLVSGVGRLQPVKESARAHIRLRSWTRIVASLTSADPLPGGEEDNEDHVPYSPMSQEAVQEEVRHPDPKP